MKTLQLFFLLSIVVTVGCEKEDADDANFIDLNIIKTETPKTTSLGQAVVSKMTVSGPDLCYKFRRTDVKAEGSNRYVVRAIGTYPKGNPVCAQAVYTADVSIDITPSIKGTYYLEFVQHDRRIKTDTVLVQ